MNTIILAGYGKMGSALARGWQQRLPDISISIIDPQPALVEQSGSANISAPYSSLSTLQNDTAPVAVVLAVKPQSMDEVLPEYAARFGTAPLYISIAAGKALSYYEKFLGAGARIIRAMPNTPSQVGFGATGLVANEHATDTDRKLAERLFAASGYVTWLEDEERMHAITALSGSGPAYAFLFLEAMAQGGKALGLNAESARELAIHTLRGACELALQSGETFAQLRQNVTSPGGTTAAAVRVLTQDERLFALVRAAMEAAAKRSEELGT